MKINGGRIVLYVKGATEKAKDELKSLGFFIESSADGETDIWTTSGEEEPNQVADILVKASQFIRNTIN